MGTQAPVYHDFVLQDAATTGNGTAADLGGISREVAVYVIWSSGTSAGAVSIETANTTDYAGTWAVLAPVPWTAASRADIVQVSGVMKAIRARISTNVVGGTVSCRLYSN